MELRISVTLRHQHGKSITRTQFSLLKSCKLRKLYCLSSDAHIYLPTTRRGSQESESYEFISGTFVLPSEKSLENLRKSSENHRNRYVLYNKKNIKPQLDDKNFMFSWHEQYFARSLRSLVRYCSCHSNIKFISSRHRVISSICFMAYQVKSTLYSRIT